MTKTSYFYGALLTGTIISGAFSSWAMAADIETSLPAVSAVNGKVDFAGGWSDIDPGSSDALFYAGAALSVPLGDTFGLQADIAALNGNSETAVGGALHFFTRDPNSYLLGAIGGVADLGNGNMVWGGGEAEFYLDNISIQSVLGVSHVDPSGIASSHTDFLGTIDLSYYATENLRFIAGGSTAGGFSSGGVGFEWLMQDALNMPVALKADVRFGEDDFVAAKAGVTFYFGGNDPGKSLIRRHREDDPPIRGFVGQSGTDIFGAGLQRASRNHVPSRRSAQWLWILRSNLYVTFASNWQQCRPFVCLR